MSCLLRRERLCDSEDSVVRPDRDYRCPGSRQKQRRKMQHCHAESMIGVLSVSAADGSEMM